MNIDDLDKDQLEDDDLDNVAGGIHGPAASGRARSRRAPVSIKAMDGSQAATSGKLPFGADAGDFLKAAKKSPTANLGWMSGAPGPKRPSAPAKRNRNI